MSRTRMTIVDSDDHTTSMDVVKVPEGFSLQMGYNRGVDRPEGFTYISVIVSPEDARRMISFMRYHDHLETRVKDFDKDVIGDEL
jgi:hypothetical protein